MLRWVIFPTFESSSRTVLCKSLEESMYFDTFIDTNNVLDQELPLVGLRSADVNVRLFYSTMKELMDYAYSVLLADTATASYGQTSSRLGGLTWPC